MAKMIEPKFVVGGTGSDGEVHLFTLVSLDESEDEDAGEPFGPYDAETEALIREELTRLDGLRYDDPESTAAPWCRE
jgi:hypothetical protein